MLRKLIMVMGLPGAGKSYFAQEFAKKIGAVHLNSDLVRKQMLEKPRYTESEKKQVYDLMFQEVCNRLDAGNTVVVDATFSRKENRIPYFDYLSKHAGLLKLIYITADEDIICQRLKKKRPDSDADYEVYKLIKAQYDPIDHPYLELSSTELGLDRMIMKALHFIQDK